MSFALRSFLRKTLAATLCFAGPAAASQPTTETTPHFGSDVRYFGKVRVGEPLRLLAAMSGVYPPGTPMRVTIALPPGVVLVSGDLSRSSVADRRGQQWEIVVRPERKGAHRIVATFVATVNERERDEGDFVLVLDTPTEADGGVSRRTRTEKVVMGQRYRYGDGCFVPIEGPEDFQQNDINVSGRKAEPVWKVAASCDACTQDSPAAVDFRVFLDKSGRLVDARALRLPPTDPAVVAARRALSNWKFRPSWLAGRSVADCLWVKVAMNPTR